MIKALQFKLYTPRQSVLTRLNETLGLCCELYNAVKESDEIHYRKFGKGLNLFDVHKLLPEVKEGRPEFKLINAQSLQDVVERYFKNKKGFFGRLQKGLRAGTPRFKSRSRYDSITFKQTGYKVQGNKLIIPTIGTFKMRLHRPIAGKIKTVTLTRKFNGIFVSFAVETQKTILPQTNQQVGIDLNVKDNFCSLSNGESFKYTKPLKQSLPEVKRKSRGFSKNTHKKRLHTLKKVYAKVRNQRHDWHHKLSRYLINNYDTIAVEDLNLQQMMTEYKNINRSFLDQGFGQFLNMMSYKAEEAGRTLVKVNPAYTSKTCSCCGVIKHDLQLTDRIFKCSACGLQEDRDINAAKNVLSLGLSQLKGADGSLVGDST